MLFSNMNLVKDLQLTYKAPNTRNVFSEGDVIVGAVTFTLTREISVKSLHVKVIGGSRFLGGNIWLCH